MTNHVMLSPDQHKNVRVSQVRSKDMGDAVMCTLTFPAEFREIQAHYPILFQRDDKTMRHYPVALFGFQPGENCFLTSEGWDADYIPAMIQKDPFFIGLQKKAEGEDPQRVVTLDMDSPRVNTEEGEALFDGAGAYTPYLDKMMAILEGIDEGYQHTELFIDALADHDLLEQVTMQINLTDGSANQLLGFYTINQDKLQQLTGDVLEEFSKKGFLAPIFMAIASMVRMRDLIKRKEATLASTSLENPLFDI